MKLSYRYRGILLLVLLIVVLPGMAWHLALRDTFGAWRDCRRLGAVLSEMTEMGEDSAFPTVPEPDVILSGLLLDSVRRAASECSVQICGYEPLVTLRQDGLAVHTARLTLTGGCKALLQIVDALESALPQCRLRTLEWRTAADRRTRQVRLSLTLYIQQIVLIP